MHEQTPQSIDLRDEVPFAQELFQEDLNVINSVHQAFSTGAIPQGESFVFPAGFFAGNKSWSRELKDSVTDKLFSGRPQARREIYRHSQDIGRFKVIKGEIVLSENSAEGPFNSAMDMWLAIDDFGDDAVLTSVEPTEESLQATIEEQRTPDDTQP